MIRVSRWYRDDCTLGILDVLGFRCFTLELPYLDNKQNVSAIEGGVYEYIYRLSPSNGDVLQLQGVPGRSYIQIHSGNYTSQIKGCILVGDSIKFLNNDNIPDVTNSKATLAEVLKRAGNSGTIEIF